MGRHHIKLPDHLYLSPPSPRPHPSSSFSAASLFSLKPTAYSSPAALIQETSSTARAVGNKIPGFQASAAFLTTLRANINLGIDDPDSVSGTPDSLRPVNLASSVSSLPPKERLSEISLDADMTTAASDADFAPPSALNLPRAALPEDAPDADAAHTKDPNEIPALVTIAAEDDTSRIEALRLVADSVAQQRQRASRILILHPITLAFIAACAAALIKYFYKGALSDFAIVGTSFAGVVMAIFVGVRGMGGGYIEEAERVGTWRWLNEGRSSADEEATGNKPVGQTDEILVTKFGDEYIAAAIFRGVKPASNSNTTAKKGSHKRSTSSASTETKTEIRAWTVKTKYRNKGVGTALLEDVLRSAQEKGWTAGGIDFAQTHANSKRVLPEMLHGPFIEEEKRTRKYLQKRVEEFEGSGSKKAVKRRK